MVVESSWVFVMTVKCLWNDRKPFFGLIFGRCLSHHPFHLIVLGSWVGCLLLDILLGLSMFTYSRIFISSCCLAFAFSLFYIENTKILSIVHCLHFIFWVLIIDLSTCIERLHLTWNFITKLKFTFWKSYNLLGIEVRNLYFIQINLFCLLSHNIISFTITPFLLSKATKSNADNLKLIRNYFIF